MAHRRRLPSSRASSLRRIFVISYDEEIGVQRSELLKARGYGVISVIGNEAAKVLRGSIQHYDLFIVGHAAPEEARREMVNWLKAQYPGIKILALNPPDQEVPSADFNVPHGPENWLSIVSKVCERRSSTRVA